MPPEYHAAVMELKISPALVPGLFSFFTGVTSADADGRMSNLPQQQIRNVFEKLDRFLR